MREEIVDSAAFADRAVDAVQQPVLRRVVAREIAVRILEPALPDVIAARPVVESAVDLAVGSKPFRPAIRAAAAHGHRLLFQRRGGNAVFDLANASIVVSSVLEKFAPKLGSKLARDLPRRVETILLTLRRRSFAAVTIRVAEKVRLLGIVLPPLALLLLALGILVAPDRRRAITRAGIVIGVTGIAFAIAFELVRRYVVTHVYGAYELTTADVRGAAGDLWGAYLGDLLTWTVVIAVVALLVAAASSELLRPYSAASRLRQLGVLAWRPAGTRIRAARGAAVLAVGLFAILKPTLALRLGAVIAGALLVYLARASCCRPRHRHSLEFDAPGLKNDT